MPQILLINPNTSPQTTAMMLAVARPLLPDGITIRGVEAARGAAMILDEPGLTIAADEVIRIGRAQAECCDAIIVSAFGNPGAGQLRETLSVPVVGIGEAAIMEAATGGRRFGVATTTPGLVRAIERSIVDLGLANSFTGVRVPGGDPLALAADPDRQERALADATDDCIRIDGAEAVVIGGGPLSATAARLRARFPAAMIEPVPAAVRRVLQIFAGSVPRAE